MAEANSNECFSFLHSINLKDQLACHNWAIPSPLGSVMAANLLAFNTPMQTPLYKCNADDLYYYPEKCFGGVGSPCFRVITMAAILRRGQYIMDGHGKAVILNQDEIDQLMFKSELEIQFEKVRQRQFAKKPSRLSSIFVVEDNIEGRFCLRQMFHKGVCAGKYTPHIMQVKISLCLKSHKADIQWLNQWAAHTEENYIVEYWKGTPFNKTPIYEYFIEGIVYPTDRSQIEEIRTNGAKFPNYDASPYWQNLRLPAFDEWFETE